MNWIIFKEDILMTLSKSFMVALISSLCLFGVSAAAGQPKLFSDPEVVAIELTEAIKNSEVDILMRDLATYTGASEEDPKLNKALEFFKGRVPQLADKVFDQTFGASLRQIVFYLPYKDFQFVYVRYNFKRMESGWLLANFNYKSDTTEIVPSGFVTGR
jgi:hypothetical protein